MDIVKHLKENGRRLTRQRKEILSLLSEKPIAANEILHIVKKNQSSLHESSVYRTLDFLTESGYIQPVDFGDGKKRYELIKKNNHHHHLVCNKCGTIDNISLRSENILLKEVSKKTKFLLQSHLLEFFGLCGNCQ